MNSDNNNGWMTTGKLRMRHIFTCLKHNSTYFYVYDFAIKYFDEKNALYYYVLSVRFRCYHLLILPSLI